MCQTYRPCTRQQDISDIYGHCIGQVYTLYQTKIPCIRHIWTLFWTGIYHVSDKKTMYQTYMDTVSDRYIPCIRHVDPEYNEIVSLMPNMIVTDW